MHYISLIAAAATGMIARDMLVSWWRMHGMPPAGIARCRRCSINDGRNNDMPADRILSHLEMHLEIEGRDNRVSVIMSKKIGETEGTVRR